MNPDNPDNTKPDKETLANRKAGTEMMIDAAMRGDGICGAALALEALAHRHGMGFVSTMVDYDDEDWDDVRPY